MPRDLLHCLDDLHASDAARGGAVPVDGGGSVLIQPGREARAVEEARVIPAGRKHHADPLARRLRRVKKGIPILRLLLADEIGVAEHKVTVHRKRERVQLIVHCNRFN